jgi:hypothetical protein
VRVRRIGELAGGVIEVNRMRSGASNAQV